MGFGVGVGVGVGAGVASELTEGVETGVGVESRVVSETTADEPPASGWPEVEGEAGKAVQPVPNRVKNRQPARRRLPILEVAFRVAGRRAAVFFSCECWFMIIPPCQQAEFPCLIRPDSAATSSMPYCRPFRKSPRRIAAQ